MDNVFEESISRHSSNKNEFSDNVQDSFGQSVTYDVYEPILDELVGLQKMLDRAVMQERAIDALTMELNLII